MDRKVNKADADWSIAILFSTFSYSLLSRNKKTFIFSWSTPRNLHQISTHALCTRQAHFFSLLWWALKARSNLTNIIKLRNFLVHLNLRNCSLLWCFFVLSFCFTCWCNYISLQGYKTARNYLLIIILQSVNVYFRNRDLKQHTFR